MFVNFNWYHLLIGNKKIREFEKKIYYIFTLGLEKNKIKMAHHYHTEIVHCSKW